MERKRTAKFCVCLTITITMLGAAKADDQNASMRELDYLIKQNSEDFDVEVSKDMQKIIFSFNDFNGLFVDITVPIDEDFLLKIFEVAVKRMNKIRTAIEALK